MTREEFQTKLMLVKPAITNADSTVEQSSCFVFRGGRVWGFNGELAINCKSGLADDIEAAVKGSKLLDSIANFPDGDLTVAITDKEMLLKKGKDKTGVYKEAAIALPVDTIEKGKVWRPWSDDMIEAIAIVGECTATGANTFNLLASCVHIDTDYVEGCDGKQMCRWNVKTGVDKSICIRQEALKEVRAKEVSETANWIHFRGNGATFSCRRYVGGFPNLDKFFATDKGTKVPTPDGIANALKAAEVFSQENKAANRVLVTLDKGKIVVRGDGLSGWASREVESSHKGKPMSFFISPKVLADITKKHSELELCGEYLVAKGDKYKWVSCIFKDEKKDETK